MTPRDLVRCVAEAVGRAEKSLVPLDRAAAEARLRTSTGGRGSSAPKMAPIDAASLILMVLAHAPGTSADATAARVSDMKNYEIRETVDGGLTLPLPHLAGMPLGVALSNLIAGNELEKWLKAEPKQRHFRLSVEIPDCVVEIGFLRWRDDDPGFDFVDVKYRGIHDLDRSIRVQTIQRIDARPLIEISRNFRD